jgi:glycosyltransferase involved in cell wall biosynthesis
MISIVMPVLNSERYVAAALESALSQDLDDLEIIVQDGGSSDGTLAAIEAVEDPRIQVASGPDRSQADALNKCIARTSGNWIVWLNADDLLAPGALKKAAGAMRDGVDLVLGDYAYVDPTGRVTRVIPTRPLERRRLLTRGCYAFSGSIVFRREVFDRFGGFDPQLRFAMDYEFYLRIAEHISMVHLSEVLAYFRVHPDSNSSTQAAGIIRETAMARWKHGGRSPLVLVPAAFNQVKMAADLLTRRLRPSS